ncbi:MAG: hypothetical protein EOM67_04070 [Spirochaetia bacterium]|nr:hypothetical protein [Spirochaetia bacterium]
MKHSKYYQEVYRVNQEDNRVIIDVSLDKYLDYFHEWDNSNYKRRDLHPDLAQFLDVCSTEIPLNRKLEIVFDIKTKHEDLQKESMIKNSYHNYYIALFQYVNREIRRKVRFSLIVAFIAIFIISMYYFILTPSNSLLISRIIREGILIGGWVFMWEAFHIIAFQTLDPIKRRRELKRLLDARLVFHPCT